MQPEGGTDANLRTDVTLRVPQAAVLQRDRIVEGKLTLQALNGSITADVRRGPIDAVEVGGHGPSRDRDWQRHREPRRG